MYFYVFFTIFLRLQAMVVGAGPAGLATALMLAKKGWAVSVFERSSNPAAYDPGNLQSDRNEFTEKLM